MPRQEKQEGMLLSNSDTFNLLYFCINVYAWALLPFLRTGIGRNGMGVPALVAMFVILWNAGENHSQEMLTYFWFWFAMVVWRRLTPGKGVISVYQGWPCLTAWLVGDEMLARLAEAVLVWVVGNWLRGWSEAVGQFVTYGSFALGLKYWLESTFIARQEEAIEDARIEMEIRTERARMRR